MNNIAKPFAALAAGLLLSSCGGGGGGDANNRPEPTTGVISGTVTPRGLNGSQHSADGVTVFAVDANGNTTSVVTAAAGRYRLELDGLTTPILLYTVIENEPGSADDEVYMAPAFSFGGRVNINLLTTLLTHISYDESTGLITNPGKWQTAYSSVLDSYDVLLGMRWVNANLNPIMTNAGLDPLLLNAWTAPDSGQLSALLAALSCSIDVAARDYYCKTNADDEVHVLSYPDSYGYLPNGFLTFAIPDGAEWEVAYEGNFWGEPIPLTIVDTTTYAPSDVEHFDDRTYNSFDTAFAAFRDTHTDSGSYAYATVNGINFESFGNGGIGSRIVGTRVGTINVNDVVRPLIFTVTYTLKEIYP